MVLSHRDARYSLPHSESRFHLLPRAEFGLDKENQRGRPCIAKKLMNFVQASRRSRRRPQPMWNDRPHKPGPRLQHKHRHVHTDGYAAGGTRRGDFELSHGNVGCVFLAQKPADVAAVRALHCHG